MSPSEARKLVSTTTNADLKQMFLNAQENIKDWTVRCRVNKGMTVGAAFNILSHGFNDFDENAPIHNIAKRNMIWAFGEFLPNYKKAIKNKELFSKPPFHEEPKKIKP